MKRFSVWHLEESKGRKAGSGDNGTKQDELGRHKVEMQVDNNILKGTFGVF